MRTHTEAFATDYTQGFTYDYRGIDVVYGRGSVGRLDELLSTRGLERAVVVCGRHVGANDELMGPLSDALGDRLAAVFDGTTPEKRVETVYEGIDVVRESEADVVVGVGGGSSLNVARQLTLFAEDGRSLDDLREEARGGRVDPPDPRAPPLPVVVVPTTFCGADLSGVGSVEVLPPDASPTGQPIRTMGSNVPVAAVHDPDLFETTPYGALAGSAMNGFNKALETVYASNATPITDATATRALGDLRESFPRLSDDDPTAMERAVIGGVLAQFDRRTSILHAIGHAFAQRYSVQQGLVHAVTAPYVLQFLFERVDARRMTLAEGLGIDTEGLSDDEVAAAVVDAVDGVREELGLPARLRELDQASRDDFPALAAFAVDDGPMRRAPPGLDPTVADVEEILLDAW